MKGNFRMLLRRYCLDSSVLGLKYLYLYPDVISRCFWTATMLTVSVFACLLTHRLYLRYTAMPTRITVENQFEPVADLPYPAITICSPNQLTLSAVRHFDKTLVDGNRTKTLESIMPQMLGFNEQVDLDLDSLAQLQSLIQKNRYTVMEVMAALPQSCTRFLKLCFFQRRTYPGCKGLFKPILTQHGLCCIFNNIYSFKNNRRNEAESNFTSIKVLRAGVRSGLTVVTDFEPEDAVDSSIYFAGSSRVMLNDWNEFPADDELSLVAPNAESFHSLRATYTYCSPDVQQLAIHSRKCYFAHEHHLPYFRQYHNSDCDLLCLARAVELTCGCQMFYLPHLRIQLSCNVTNVACINGVKRQMNLWSQTAECQCLRDCDSRHYGVDSSIGNLDALPYMTHNPYEGIVFNKSTSILHFFFAAPVYVKQKQETVLSITTLVANLGGVFGLCMGCSVLSVLELSHYAYAAARHRVRAALRRRMAPPRPTIAYIN